MLDGVFKDDEEYHEVDTKRVKTNETHSKPCP